MSHAFFLAMVFSISVFLIREYALFVAVFYVIFAIVALGLSIFYVWNNKCNLANFYCGVVLSFIVLIPFKALPFIPSWTRPKALLNFFGLPIHHWVIGFVVLVLAILLYVFHIKRDRLPSHMYRCFQCFIHPYLISFLVGFGTFLFASQIAEMFIHMNPFWL